MDQENHHQNLSNTVLYRCPCGQQLALVSSEGGTCTNCNRDVTPRILEHDLAMTVTLDDESFELDQTLPGNHDIDQSLLLNQQLATCEASPSVLVGKMFGHFEIISPIGRGGMGQVYRALDTSLQRYAAVKVLRSGISDSNGSTRSSGSEIDKLLQEAVSQARVAHPNVVTIYYVGKQDGDPFLAMELVNGEPLSKRIEEKSIGFDEVAPVTIDIANALKVSYEIGIIHGDIKPSNVLITKNGSAKLSDFGMARDVSDKSAVVGGTPNYIAPEILGGDKPTLQSDIYALGVTFYEMTFSRLPITLTGRTVDEWLCIHEGTEIEFPTPWPSNLPEKWRNILLKMLRKDPELRYQSYEELITDLNLIQPESKVNARLFPRLVAAGIDWITVLSLALLVQYAIRTGSLEKLFENYPRSLILLRAAEFLPIITYLMVIYFWRQSLGRNLMHLRVVNRFGMIPSSREMVTRSLIRMQFPFFAMILQLLVIFSATSIQVTLSILFIVSLVFLLFDMTFMLLYNKHRSIHDLFTQTQVVLDTQSNSTS